MDLKGLARISSRVLDGARRVAIQEPSIRQAYSGESFQRVYSAYSEVYPTKAFAFAN